MFDHVEQHLSDLLQKHWCYPYSYMEKWYFVSFAEIRVVFLSWRKGVAEPISSIKQKKNPTSIFYSIKIYTHTQKSLLSKLLFSGMFSFISFGWNGFTEIKDIMQSIHVGWYRWSQ